MNVTLKTERTIAVDGTVLAQQRGETVTVRGHTVQLSNQHESDYLFDGVVSLVNNLVSEVESK